MTLLQSKFKNIILLLALALCFFPTLCTAHARSTHSDDQGKDIFKSQSLPFPKVPLPPATTSVKCKCQPQVSDSSSSSSVPPVGNIQSRSDEARGLLQDPQSDSSSIIKEIEIEIFRPDETDFSKLVQEYPNTPNNLQKDSSNVHEPISAKTYKSFRTAELLDPIIYSEIGGNVKQPTTEFLQLGKNFGPFEGPRRRRRRSVPPSSKTSKVFYVYSVKFDNSSQEFESSSTSTTTTELPTEFLTTTTTPNLFPSFFYPVGSVPTTLNPNSKFSERNIQVQDELPISPPTLDHAMSQSWLDYGPKSIPPPHLLQERPNNNLPSPPGYLSLPQNPLLFNSYQFQRQGDFLTSPWDNRIKPNPLEHPVVESNEPGFFSPLLSRYIDFEVNNHEAADFARKLLFGFVIGTLIAAWIALGVGLGIFPLNLLFAGKETEKTRSNLDLLKRNAGGLSADKDKDLENVGNRVMLALEPDWLKKLEERVMKGNEQKMNFIRTVAKCCVKPKEEKVVCILGNKDKTGKVDGDPVSCVGSDLIYNFEFGGDEDEDEETGNNSRVKIRNST